jgi:hypothetical protein
MKGVVFTEFMDMVDAAWGPDLLDDVLDAAAVPNGGAYTSVGTYPAAEMGRLVGALASTTGEDVRSLLHAFGAHLLTTFEKAHPQWFAFDEPLAFLAQVDGYIHVEVRKLYPDAELPRFEILEQSDQRLVLDYRSPRCLHALAEGMILATLKRWGREGQVEVTAVEPAGSHVRFDIRLTR